MKKHTINYTQLFNLFCEKEASWNYNFETPFKQDGFYYATDRHSLISMPDKSELDFKELDKPNIEAILPTEFHPPIEIDIKELKQKLIEKTPLVDEKKEEDKKCKECDGDGYLECDLGHEHDCHKCDGEGTVVCKELTGNKIPDKEAVFKYRDFYLKQFELDRLVKACEMIGVNKIHKVAGIGTRSLYFKAGDFYILVMACVNVGDRAIEL